MNYYRFAGEPAQYDYEWNGQALTPVKAAPGSLGAAAGGIPWAKLLLWGAVGYAAYKMMASPRSNPGGDPEGFPLEDLPTSPATSDALTERIQDRVNLIFDEATTAREPGAVVRGEWVDEGVDDALKGRLTINQIVNQPDHNNRFGQANQRGRRAAAGQAATPATTSRRRGRRAARQGSRLRPFEGRP